MGDLSVLEVLGLVFVAGAATGYIINRAQNYLEDRALAKRARREIEETGDVRRSTRDDISWRVGHHYGSNPNAVARPLRRLLPEIREVWR